MSKTKLDHLYGVTSQNVDLTPINNKITALETNTLKKNVANEMMGVNNPITFKRNNETKLKWTDDFNDNKMTIGRTSDYNNQIETFDNDLHIKTPANKNVILDQGGITCAKVPASNNDLVNKVYVDGRTSSPWEMVVEQVNINFKTTNLTWTKSSHFSTTGKYEFHVEVHTYTNRYEYYVIFNITEFTNDYYGPACFYNYTVKNSETIANAPANGFYLVFNNGVIKIVKFGQNQPETSTVRIFVRKSSN